MINNYTYKFIKRIIVVIICYNYLRGVSMIALTIAIVFFVIILFLSIGIFFLPSFLSTILGLLFPIILVGYIILLVIFITISIIRLIRKKDKTYLSKLFFYLGLVIITIGIIFIYKDFDQIYYSLELTKNIKKEFRNVDVIKDYDYSKDKKEDEDIIVGKTVILNDDYKIPFQVYSNTSPMFGYADITYTNNYFYKYGPIYLKEFNNAYKTNLKIEFIYEKGFNICNYTCSDSFLCHDVKDIPDLESYIKYVNSKSPDNTSFTINLIYDNNNKVNSIGSWNIK